MDDLISRKGLVDLLTRPTGFRANCEDCCEIDCLSCVIDEAIGNAPAVEAEPVRHGRWIEKPYLLGTSRFCSLCGSNYGMPHEVYNFCPNCGVKMDLEGNHEA